MLCHYGRKLSQEKFYEIDTSSSIVSRLLIS
jgi:hypothetical protein